MFKQIYQIGLFLKHNRYIDFTDSKNLFDNNIQFNLYKWHEDYGWRAWIAFTGRSWTKLDKLKEYGEGTVCLLKPMHLFFKTEKEFEKYIGKEMCKKIMVDLL
jgi:hypothetical protein